MVNFFGASAATEAAYRLEKMGEQEQIADARGVLEYLIAEIAALQSLLQPLCGDNQE
jgi:hypothetical protein